MTIILGSKLKVTSLDDLGDVVVLDKGTTASSLLNMLRQRMSQPQETGRQRPPGSGTIFTVIEISRLFLRAKQVVNFKTL